MPICQLNVSYFDSEDRILLRVAMTEGDELRFWLTRAGLRTFVPQVTAWLSAADGSPGAAVRAFKLEAAAAQADFSNALLPGETFPLGEAPILVESLRLESEDTSTRLQLHLQDKRVVTLHLDEEALAGLQKLLNDTARAADWGLPEILPTVSVPGKVH